MLDCLRRCNVELCEQRVTVHAAALRILGACRGPILDELAEKDVVEVECLCNLAACTHFVDALGRC